ncbi:hypothetical protein ASF22_20185 [Methylobacterium sp. Leaf87]|nr:hypothetical protein ASF22_20185 [Methylobacterium sp. Leaf87]
MARKAEGTMAAYRAALARTERARHNVSAARLDLKSSEAREVRAFDTALVTLAREIGLHRIDPDVLAAELRRLAPLCKSTTAASSFVTAPTRRRAAAASPDTPEQDWTGPIDGDRPFQVTVRISGNVGRKKRACFEKWAMTWNGRLGVWHGRVDEAGLDELHSIIGTDRVEVAAQAPETRLTEESEDSDGGSETSGIVLDDPPAAVENNPARAATVDRDPRVVSSRLPPMRADTPAYRYAEIARPCPSTPLAETPDDAIRGMAMRVIEIEGLVHKEEIFVRIRDAYALRTISAGLRTTLDRVIADIDPAEVSREGDFLILRGAAILVRDRRNARDTTKHYERLPLSELRLAILDELASGRKLDPTKLIICVARRMGYATMGHGLRSRIKLARDTPAARLLLSETLGSDPMGSQVIANGGQAFGVDTNYTLSDMGPRAAGPMT